MLNYQDAMGTGVYMPPARVISPGAFRRRTLPIIGDGRGGVPLSIGNRDLRDARAADGLGRPNGCYANERVPLPGFEPGFPP